MNLQMVLSSKHQQLQAEEKNILKVGEILANISQYAPEPIQEKEMTPTYSQNPAYKITFSVLVHLK